MTFQPYFVGDTLDDVMREVIQAILAHGSPVEPSKGPTKELTGAVLEIANPRARLSRTETRGRPFSCLGELCWYLAGTNALSFIEYYIPRYRKYADGDVIYGGYGPRLFNWRKEGLNQIANVTKILRQKRASRQAVIQLFDANDIVDDHNDTPCTCTLQFMIRDDRLWMFTHMRSNDAFVGLPHDIFCFTMLQEIMARDLDVELGPYKHTAGSLHLYDQNGAAAEELLAEGWQSTVPMPPMPAGNPWPAIESLRRAEDNIRNGRVPDVNGLDPYWVDLVRLLQVFRCAKNKDAEGLKSLRSSMSSPVYDLFIEAKLRKMS